DDRGTSPGQIDDDDSEVETNVRDSQLPMVSEVREIEPSGGGDNQTRDARARKKSQQQRQQSPADDDADPEASFVKAVQQSSSLKGRGERGEVTVVKAPAVDRPPRRGARVIVLEGADQGGEADIETNPCMIGRTATAEIGLTDP